MIKAVLFDLDGTLINSLDDLADGVNHTLSKYGFPTHETEKYKIFVGNGMRNLIERTIPEKYRNTETHDRVLADFMAYYKEHSLCKTAPYEDIMALLEALRDKGIKSAIITNKAHAAAQRIAEYFFGDLISRTYGQREGIPTKPDPMLVNMVLAEMNLKREECIFVGDSGMDMLVGVNSGITPVGVTWGFRSAEELKQNGAEYLIDTPLELLEILK